MANTAHRVGAYIKTGSEEHRETVRDGQYNLVAILLLLLLLLLPHCFDRNAQKSAVSSLDIEAAATAVYM